MYVFVFEFTCVYVSDCVCDYICVSCLCACTPVCMCVSTCVRLNVHSDKTRSDPELFFVSVKLSGDLF